MVIPLLLNERIIKSSRVKIVDPSIGSGQLYLTNKRLIITRKFDIFRKYEDILISENLENIDSVKIKGFISKLLVIYIRTANIMKVIKLKINEPEDWQLSIIYQKTIKY